VLNRCVELGKMCMDEMSSIDAKGGLGLAGINNVHPLEYDKYRRRGAIFAPPTTYVARICTTEEEERMRAAAQSPLLSPRDSSPILGAGLPRPTAPLFGAQRRPSNS